MINELNRKSPETCKSLRNLSLIKPDDIFIQTRTFVWGNRRFRNLSFRNGFLHSDRYTVARRSIRYNTSNLCAIPSFNICNCTNCTGRKNFAETTTGSFLQVNIKQSIFRDIGGWALIVAEKLKIGLGNFLISFSFWRKQCSIHF